MGNNKIFLVRPGDGFYRLFIPDDLPAAKLAIAHHNRFLTQIKNSGKTVSLEEIKRIASDEEITGLLDPASDIPIDELPTDLPTVPPKKTSLLQKLRDVYEQNIAEPCGLPKIGLSPTKKSALADLGTSDKSLNDWAVNLALSITSANGEVLGAATGPCPLDPRNWFCL